MREEQLQNKCHSYWVVKCTNMKSDQRCECDLIVQCAVGSLVCFVTAGNVQLVQKRTLDWTGQVNKKKWVAMPRYIQNNWKWCVLHSNVHTGQTLYSIWNSSPVCILIGRQICVLCIVKIMSASILISYPCCFSLELTPSWSCLIFRVDRWMLNTWVEDTIRKMADAALCWEVRPIPTTKNETMAFIKTPKIDDDK